MTVRSPEPGPDFEPLADLFARSFTEYDERRRYPADGYLSDGPYDWSASRLGIVDDTVACHFGVWGFDMRIGHAVTRLAGIGAVATLERYRRRGLVTTIANECVAGLAAAGYHLSLLFGIPNYYDRFGYVGTFPESRFLLETRDLDADPPAGPEPFDGDVVELAAPYNRDNDGVTGTCVRPTYLRNRKPGDFTIHRCGEDYLVVQRAGNTLRVADCAGDPAAVVAMVRELAVRELCTEIEFTFLPRRSRVGEHLQLLTHRHTRRHRRSAGAMARIVALEPLCRAVAPELSARLQASGLARYGGRLVLHGDGESVVIGISSGEVAEVCACGPAEEAEGIVSAGPALVRLFLGDEEPLRICRQAGIALSGDASRLVPVLFPDQEPSTILWDRF